MDFNDFALDLLVDDQEMDLLEDTPVFRPPATCASVFKFINGYSKEHKILLPPGHVLSDRRLSPSSRPSNQSKLPTTYTEKHPPKIAFH